MNASDLTLGSTVTVRRITRTGAPRTWTGELLGVGTMQNSTGPMDYVVLSTDHGREIFAVDPAFSTTLDVEPVPCSYTGCRGHYLALGLVAPVFCSDHADLGPVA